MRRQAALGCALLLSVVCCLPAFARAEAICLEDEEQGASDFAASKGASAEQLLQQLLRQRVRTIARLSTQYFVGGYVQFDGIFGLKEQTGKEQDTLFVSATPFESANKLYRLSPRQTQLLWASCTKTKLGAVWTRFDANLFPLDGTTFPTVNQLMLRWEDYLVLGKTYSTFMDDGALPTTLDYNGPSGVTFVRQWLARIGVPLGDAWLLAASVEQAQADVSTSESERELSVSAQRPDFAARVRYESDSAHFQLAGLSRRVHVQAAGDFGERASSVRGLGISMSGSFTPVGDDLVLFQAVSGTGINRYFNDPLTLTGVSLSSSGEATLLRTTGTSLYYQRKWSDDWMTVAGASAFWLDSEGSRSGESLRRSVYASTNLIYHIVPMLLAGSELLLGQATRVDGASALNFRLQLSVRYLLF